MNCWGRREPTGLSDSPVKPSVQTIQFRFDGFLVQLAGLDQNCDRSAVRLASLIQFLKPWFYLWKTLLVQTTKCENSFVTRQESLKASFVLVTIHFLYLFFF